MHCAMHRLTLWVVVTDLVYAGVLGGAILILKRGVWVVELMSNINFG